MPCYSPLKVVNPSLKRLERLKIYKNGIPNNKQTSEYKRLAQYIERGNLWIHVPCGRCEGCRRSRRADLKSRLMLAHQKYFSYRGVFLTLTFSDENLRRLTPNGGIPARSKVTVVLRRFFDRWRKKYGRVPPHFVIDELGGEKGRYHLHGVAYIHPEAGLSVGSFCTLAQLNREVATLWKNGFVFVGWCSERTISYITKYITKIDYDDKAFVPRTWSSRNFYYSESRVCYDRVQLVLDPSAATYCAGGFSYVYPRSYRQRLQGFWDRLPSRVSFLENKVLHPSYTIPGIGYTTYSSWKQYQEALRTGRYIPGFKRPNSDILPDYDFGLPF